MIGPARHRMLRLGGGMACHYVPPFAKRISEPRAAMGLPARKCGGLARGSHECVSCSCLALARCTMPEDNPIIRKFEPGDIGEILEIERQAFPKTAYSRKLLLHYAAHFPETFMVVETGKGIAGYIIFDKSGHIHSTAVKVPHRRRGFGAMLFRHAFNHVDRKVWLEVRSRNIGAIEFYKRMGMSISGRVPYYYGNDDALVMVLQHKEKAS
ncbi:MAG: GNAT family N-acetyltransferase [Deltaproteobacteria bacterium]|nr:GNAT family N-acetyltransferase [Deltaproteobacteria bacterium]